MFPMAYTGQLSPPAAAERDAHRAELAELSERIYQLSTAMIGDLTRLHLQSAWRAVGWAIEAFEGRT